jgi:thiol-disulfide isomerase/thioredoxin
MKKPTWLMIGVVLLTACAVPPAEAAQPLPKDEAATLTAGASNLPDLGAAPELTNDVWLNSDQPLRLADLRGKVVLLEMWTFGCINCQHVIPSLKAWYDTYADQGLVIIGNHYPEFSYEKDLDNLKQAVADFDIRYPIAQDNDGATWRSYNTMYWPMLYLIDKNGHIRYTHVGEGAYQATENAIQELLAESASSS